MRRVALTGGIATGKSYVRECFDGLGVPTLDADQVARRVVAVGTDGLAALVTRFGPAVLDATDALDRSKLAAIVFAEPAARLDLEAIVHPAVRQATEAWFAGLDPSPCPVAIADIPLLYEVGRDGDFDAVIVVACEPETQVRRAMARDGLPEADVRQRLAAQWPIEKKVQLAEFVITTDGTKQQTHEQVEQALKALLRIPR